MEITGSAIVERIDTLLKEKGETRKALVAVGAIKDTQSVTNWLQRGTIPAADVALAIADYFNVSVRWLLTGKDEAGLSREEWNLISSYGCLTAENKRNVRGLIDTMLSVSDEGKKEEIA